MQRFPKKASFAKLDSQETTAIVPKITYHGFCGKCATRAIGHACLFAEQGNRVRIPDTEGISSLRLQPMNHRVQRGWQNSESSCISKVLFSVQRNLRAVKTGHWKGCHGSERRLKQCVCARKNPPHMNGSVRRPTNHRNERNLREKARVISAYPAHKGDG